MKMFALLLGLYFTALPIVAFGQDLAGYEKLPPVADRTLQGQWNLGHSCTGALISGDGKIYWAQVCIFNTGCCNGVYGFVLKRTGSRVYIDRHRKTTYTIQKNGDMNVTTLGRPVLTYSTKLGPDNPTWTHLESWQIE